MTKVLEFQQDNDMPKKSNRLGFFAGIAFMWLLLFARNVLNIGIPVFALLAVGAVIAMLGDRDEIIALAVCCIPMSNSFQYKYLVLLCIVIYLIKFSSDIRINTAILPLLFMMIWELLHGIGYSFSFYEYLRGFSELIFVTFLMLLKPRKIDFPFIVRILAWVSVGMMLIVLVNLLIESNFDFEAIFNGYYRFGRVDNGAEDFGGDYNPNGLGMICNLSIACIMILSLFGKARLSDYIVLGTLAVFGIMTMSRSFIICLAFLIILYIFSTKESVIKKVRTILIICLIAALLLFIVQATMPYVIDNFLGRFENDDVLNGRDELFSFYTEHIFSSPEYFLFGIGKQDFAIKIHTIYNNDINVSHNGIQELVVCWGAIGLILFIWFLVKMVNNSFNSKKTLACFMPLFLILLKVQSGQLITTGSTLLSFAIALIALQCGAEEEHYG